MQGGEEVAPAKTTSQGGPATWQVSGFHSGGGPEVALDAAGYCA
jgi:hypothetical protein